MWGASELPERKGHGEPGDITEFYPTKPELARLIVDRVADDFNLRPKMVLEPGCGAGSFMTGMRDRWPQSNIFGVEVDPLIAEHAKRQQFLVTVDDLLKRHWGKFDAIVGNPPFSISERFIHHLRDHLSEDGILVFLLRLNFLATQERYETLWERYKPAKVYPLVARPGFTSDGSTDGTDYGVVVWKKEPSLETTMSWLDNRSVESRWSLGRRAKKNPKTKQIIEPAVPDPRFPVVPRVRGVQVIEDAPQVVVAQ